MSESENSEFDFWLPQGAQLVPVLSSYNVKDSDLHSLLKRKGIYIGERDRKQMIMLLASTLITSSDFDYLIGRVSDREDTYRTTTGNASCYDDADAISSAVTEPHIQKLMELASDKHPMFNVKSFLFNKKSEDHIEITGKVETHDWLRNIHAAPKVHEFSFGIEKRGNIINYTSGTTTIETKKLTEYIREEVDNILKSSGIITRKSKVFILRNDFFVDQVNMFKFFK